MILRYDIQTNSSTARKILGKTDYYVGVSKICARCKKAIVGYPAISRVDNKTEICSNCGTLEALEALEIFKKHNKKEVEDEKRI